jgi:outer membrane protein assembly complex protein YaeT
MGEIDRSPGRQWVALLALMALATPLFSQTADGPIIEEVLTRGHRIIPRDQILSQIKTRPGQRFDEEQAREDVQKLKESGAFGDIRVSTRSTGDKKVIVIFDLAELPSLIREIVYKGAKHMKPKDLDALTGLRRGSPLNPAANLLACRAIEQKYRDDGRIFAKVLLEEGGKVGDTRVVFNITEGPEVKVRSIRFVGHGSWVSSGRLRTQISSSRSFLGIGGTFEPRKLEADTLALRDYYRGLGFLDADIVPETRFTDDHTGVDIIFHIHEGPRYKVAAVALKGNKQYDQSQLMPLVHLKPGDYFDKNVVQADVTALQDKYGVNGQRVPVRESLSLVPGKPGLVQVQYQIQESEPVRVRQILIVGNEQTKDSVILRVLGIREGQVLSWPEIRAAEVRLANLQLFENNPETGSRPTISVVDTDDPRYKDILVNVRETTTGSFMLGVGVNSNAGLSGQIVLNERNFDILRFPRSLDDLLSGRAFRGGGQEFRIEAIPGTRFQRYTISWREPALFDTPFGLAISGYYYNRGYIEYNEGRIGTRVSVSRQLNRFWNVNETFRLEGIHIFEVPNFATPAIRDNLGWDTLIGFRTGLTRDSRDSYLRPTRGSVLDLAFEQVVGSHVFPVGSVEFSKYWTTWQRRDGSGRHVLSMRSQAVFAGNDTPVYERLYAGGFQSLRGFAFRGVGPFENGLNVGGQFAFLNTIEYQIPVLANDKFFVVGFLDHGTVERKFDITTYRVTAGIGLRIITPITGPVPLALDFGFPIVKGPFDQKQILAFYVGFGGN